MPYFAPPDSMASFNPRAREGRDIQVRDFCLVKIVSIHAPARGATSRLCQLTGGQVVSIHAPARGATFRCAIFALSK